MATRNMSLFAGEDKRTRKFTKEIDPIAGKVRYPATLTYNSWRNMITRCYNPKHEHHSFYGGRGITVCDRWRRSFDAFIADLGERPSREHTLEREDPDGNYEPGNCVWATKEVQANNTRSNRRIKAFGETLTVAQWSRRTGFGDTTIRVRLKAGMSPEEALAVPVGAIPPVTGAAHHMAVSITNGVKTWGCIPEAVAETGIPHSTLRRWAKAGRNGWSLA